MRSFAPALFLLALAAAPAAAEGTGPPPADPVGDYRWALYTACTVAFALITAFLIVTHLRTRRAAEEISHLERRLDALDRPPPAKHGS